ncbi:MAG: hypothetical protein SF339_11330 [Blastocatellia bacterium]|nr:hypothetical protein [Blastocatellia bacterium]
MPGPVSDLLLSPLAQGIALALLLFGGGVFAESHPLCPPTITAKRVAVAQCETLVDEPIATVSDDETSAASLLVEVAAAPAGIAVGEILVNDEGLVTALIAVECGVAPGVYFVDLKVTDFEELTATAQLAVVVTAANSPGTEARIGFQPAGSVLVFNLYSSNPTSPEQENTRISLTNINPTRRVTVHLFFVEGQSCQVADMFICLTPNQTTSFLAWDLDPGTTGFLVAVAVDGATGVPISFNSLIGEEYVKLESGHHANLPAEFFAAREDAAPAVAIDEISAELRFDGVNYQAMPRALAAANLQSNGTGNDTLLVLNRIGGNMMLMADGIGTVSGMLFDDLETGYSFCFTNMACQLKASLNNNLPETSPDFETAIPAGRSGWMKLWNADDAGLLGATLVHNPLSIITVEAFNQGHNLHKLSHSTTTRLLIPIFPANC